MMTELSLKKNHCKQGFDMLSKVIMVKITNVLLLILKSKNIYIKYIFKNNLKFLIVSILNIVFLSIHF